MGKLTPAWGDLRWRAGAWWALATLCCWVSGCTTPGGPAAGRIGGATPDRPVAQPPQRAVDGPPPGAPPDLSTLANAEPRVEPIRSGGPNKPYEVLGRSYVPLAGDVPLVEKGLASWYGQKFHGRRTASGETYNMLAMTAAHRTMPIPSYARVRNPANGREIIVRVNDRGPFSPDRVIDLSYAAAVKLGLQGGVAAVEVERITHDEIRAGLGQPEPAPAPDPIGSIAVADAAPDWLRGGTPARTEPPPHGLSPAGAPAVAPVVPASTGAASQPPERIRPAPAGVRQAAVEAPPAAGGAGASPAAAPAAVASAPTDAAAAAVTQARTQPGAQLPGTAPQRGRAFTPAASGFWLQLGAFARGEGAYTFQQRVAQELGWLSPLLTVFAEGSLHRLQAGPYASREQAREVAEKLRSSLQLVPVIVERR